MFDLKTMKLAMDQLEQEKKIPKDKILEAIEHSLAAAYKKEYGKKGQIVRCKFNLDDGTTSFYQVKITVDETVVRIVEEDEVETEIVAEGDERSRYNEEHHIMIDDARRIKENAQLEDEVIFPLEDKADFGRIAAQTAKQVIIQKIRDAERSTIIDEYGSKEGEIVHGHVEKFENGMVYVDFNRAKGVIPREEQIPGERFERGDRISAYLFSVEEGMRGVNLRLSRSHPQFVKALFEIEAPEIATGVVEIKSIAREAGSRTKIAVASNDPHVDPTGACVGGRGVRVTTVTNEINGEKIDVIEWSEDPSIYVAKALAPAKVLDIQIDEAEHQAKVEVAEDQLSLAIGKGGQNVRLAAKLTGWRIDIKGQKGEVIQGGDDIFGDVEADESDAEIANTITEDKTIPEENTVAEVVEEIAEELAEEAVKE